MSFNKIKNKHSKPRQIQRSSTDEGPRETISGTISAVLRARVVKVVHDPKSGFMNLSHFVEQALNEYLSLLGAK